MALSRQAGKDEDEGALGEEVRQAVKECEANGWSAKGKTKKIKTNEKAKGKGKGKRKAVEEGDDDDEEDEESDV